MTEQTGWSSSTEVSLLFALTVTGIAAALGEAESRPEQQTLLAVGAHPRLRRRITAARAGIIVLLGGLLAGVEAHP